MSGIGPVSWSELWHVLWAEMVKALAVPKGGAGIVTELGSGHSVDEERKANVLKLLQIGEEAVSNQAWFQRPDGTTYCNRGAAFIAQGMGYFGFRHGALANQMISHMSHNPEWREDSIDRAWKHACNGGLAFLCIEAQPHGHIAALAPLAKEPSGSWGESVPMLFNVGPSKAHGIVKASVAYKAADKPKLRAFLWGIV